MAAGTRFYNKPKPEGGEDWVGKLGSRMMRSLLFFIFIFASLSVVAAPDNSNGEKFEALEQKIQDILRSLESLNLENALLKDAVGDLEADLAESNADLSSLEDKLFELSGSGGNGESAEFVFVGLSEDSFVYPPESASDFLVGACQRVYGPESRMATSGELKASTFSATNDETFFVRGEYRTVGWGGTGSSGLPKGGLYEANLGGGYFNYRFQTIAPVVVTDGLTAGLLIGRTGFEPKYQIATRVGCSAKPS
jgi:hypothetical protein